jgi:Ca-activated chloride channel family protein
VLEHTPVAQRDTIARAINGLGIEGSTNVEAGLRQAYQLASRNFTEGAINRVILCSDGVANVGATGPDAILERVRDYASQGVLLTTVGFGMDYNDYLMEQLANDGNGNYAYVDTLDEAERVFVDNMTGTLQVIARDAKIQVEFNPEVVSQYRLLGYENRAVADTDFRNDEVDAGEVGAGHSVTALYEMRLTGQGSGEALVAQVRYEDPDSGEVRELASPLNTDAFAADYSTAPANLRLAVAAAAFAEQLRDSGYAQNRTLDDVLVLAEDVAPQFANDSQVQEFVALVRQAQAVSR